MKAGAIDFLQKPFIDEALLDIVHGALRRDREARQDRVEVAEIQRRFNALTPRERDVFWIVIQGRTNKQIADELGISEKTLKTHRGRMMQKMQVESLAELIRHADRLAKRATRRGRPLERERGIAGSNPLSRDSLKRSPASRPPKFRVLIVEDRSHVLGEAIGALRGFWLATSSGPGMLFARAASIFWFHRFHLGSNGALYIPTHPRR
jgi:DNA-binding CsgD family transcriptional regulator